MFPLGCFRGLPCLRVLLARFRLAPLGLAGRRVERNGMPCVIGAGEPLGQTPQADVGVQLRVQVREVLPGVGDPLA